ncbi:MAG TPA: VWA domain-containing protein, partial [Acidimicrobiia bacterium]
MAGAFGQLLHDAGVPVTPERSGRFSRAMSLAAPMTVDELYWLGRVTLLTGFDQIAMFDAVFDQVFRGLLDPADARGDPNAPAPPHTRPGKPKPPPPAADDAPARSAGGARPGDLSGPDGDDASAPPSVLAAASPEERLGQRDFADLTPEELDSLRALIADLSVAPPLRASRRRQRHHLGRRLDLRATLRRSHRHSGDPVEWILRRPKSRPRRLVLIADVSGSM